MRLFPSGTKRKSERSESQELKRLRPSSRQAPSRSLSSNKRSSGPPLSSSSSSSKNTGSSPRGRHAATSGYSHEYYDERKGHRGSREATRSRGGEEPRGRESQRGVEALNQVPVNTEACIYIYIYVFVCVYACIYIIFICICLYVYNS